MRILVDFNFPSTRAPDGGQQFFLGLINQMVADSPCNSYTFITNDPKKFEGRVFTNVQFLNPGRLLNYALGRKYWYRFKLASLVKQLQSERVFAADNPLIRKSGSPLVLFLVNPPDHTKSSFPGLSRAAVAADMVISFTKAWQDFLTLDKNKLHHVAATVRQSSIPLTWDEREQVKRQYTGGREYFIFVDDSPGRYDLLGLLKAFSAFKKRQHSNMQLVITGMPALLQSARKLLEAYKYRDDVHVLDTPAPAVHTTIIEVAYAFLYPVLEYVFPFAMLQAVRLGIPVISYPGRTVDEIFGDHVLKADANDFNDLSKNMQLLYKDEVLRSRMIENAQAYIMPVTGNEPAEQCLKIIESTAG